MRVVGQAKKYSGRRRRRWRLIRILRQNAGKAQSDKNSFFVVVDDFPKIGFTWKEKMEKEKEAERRKEKGRQKMMKKRLESSKKSESERNHFLLGLWGPVSQVFLLLLLLRRRRRHKKRRNRECASTSGWRAGRRRRRKPAERAGGAVWQIRGIAGAKN